MVVAESLKRFGLKRLLVGHICLKQLSGWKKDKEMRLRFLWRILAQVGHVSRGPVIFVSQNRRRHRGQTAQAQLSTCTGYLNEKFPNLHLVQQLLSSQMEHLDED